MRTRNERMIQIVIAIVVVINSSNSVSAQYKVDDISMSTKDSLRSIHDALSEAIGDAKIVLLGEQTHYDGSTFEVRLDYIKYLHEELGFNLLVFESGLFDLDKANRLMREKLSLKEIFNHGVFPQSTLMGIWLESKEFKLLIDYMENHPKLEIAGFDCQVSSNFTLDYLTKELVGFLNLFGEDIPSKDVITIEEALNELLGGDFRNFLSIEQDYVDFVSLLKKLEVKLLKIRGNERAKFWVQWIRSFGASIQYFRSEAKGKKFVVQNPRDSIMAENFRFVVENNANKKIIGLGANFHFARNLNYIEYDNIVTQSILDTRKQFAGYQKEDTLTISKMMMGAIPMGHRLKGYFGDDLFTIAFTAYKGNWGFSGDKDFTFEIDKPPLNSLEDKFNSIGKKACFFHSREVGGKLFSHSLGYLPVMGEWSKIFDGFAFLREMHPVTPIVDTLSINEKSRGKYRGKIIDIKTGEPLAYANVILENTPIATISNFNGYFDLAIPEKHKRDSLIVSYIGYESRKTVASKLSRGFINYFKLHPSATMLMEVVVNADISPEQIIERVRESIPYNYPQSAYGSQLFYRHKRLVNDSLSYIQEAALDFYDSEGFKREAGNKIFRGKFLQIKQLRRSTSIEKNQNLGLWDIPFFWSSDPILSLNNIISRGRMKDYNLVLVGKKKFEDRLVYELKFDCKKPSVYTTGYGYPSPASYIGKIYVDVESYAVIHFEAFIKWNRDLIKDLKWLSRFNVNNRSYFDRSEEIIFSYRRFENQYFPHYAKKMQYFTFTSNESKQESKLIYQNELLSNVIEIHSPKKLSETILRVEPKDIPYNKSFWDNFNFIVDEEK